MKLKHRVVCAALLVAAAAPAWALQLGQIQVKSALNQPLVAAIPLHPENLTELDGLTVGLAPAADFAQAGLQVTPTDQTLRFHVTTDNNGQKLILVTSTAPITDPYLDFLIQVSTRQGKQVREFVVLLNPVIAAPTPEVQTAPVATAPAANVQAPAELPPASAFPQPAPQPAPKPQAIAPPPPPQPKSPAPASAAQPASKPAPTAQTTPGTIHVERGDTLYVIAKREVEENRASINQMMLALKTANPDAFFKDNINNLKSGAILRIPTRDEIDQTSAAEASAAVHRQYEAWRSARAQPATVVAGTAAEAAANAAPKPGNAPESDHLTLTPPASEGGSAANRPGVTGGTGKETVAGLQQQLQNDRGNLVSLAQSNADLESRARSLQDIAGKTDKLLSLKDATVAELQRKLADVQSGKLATVAPGAPAASAPASAAAASKPAAQAPAAGTAWFNRPLTWLIAGLVVLALILIGLLRRRRGGERDDAPGKGPLSDPMDVTSLHPEAPDYEAALRAGLAEDPANLATHLKLARLYSSRGDEAGFIEVAKAMREHVTDLHGAAWREVAEMGEELAPHLPLFELPPEPYTLPERMEDAPESHDGEHADQESFHEHPDEDHLHRGMVLAEPDAAVAPESESGSAHEHEVVAGIIAGAEPEFADDPVDTKLDLARAYLDMGDPVGARAMLDEVLEEGSEAQKDEARRLLAEVTE